MRTRNSQHYPLKGDLNIIQEILSKLIEDAYEALAPHTSRADLFLDLQTLRRRLSCEGLRFATVMLPNLSKAFLAYVETGTFTSTDFKIRRGTPIFLRGLFVCYECNYRKTVAFRAIYQITNLFKKLRGDYNKSAIADMIDEFILNDIRLGVIEEQLRENVPQELKLARYLVKRDFGTVDPHHPTFVGRPGPGATNSKTERQYRYEPNCLYTRHDDVMPYAEWFYPLLTDVNHRAQHYISLMKTAKYEPTARYKIVPKYWAKGRGICIEENEAQFLQQALAAGIRHRIDTSYLRKYIQIDNQNLNAGLAYESSLTQENATIDMSDASDNILRYIVLYLFQDTMLAECLDAAATRLVVLDEETHLNYLALRRGTDPLFKGAIRLNKFAPMGSGLCFPIMTLVHYYIIRAILCRKCGLSLEDTEKIYVYGDDIVLPSQYAQAVFDELPKYGMKLNRNKSFVSSKFRESCGIHAYNGVDVTPVYMKYIPNSDTPTVLHACCVAEYSLRKLHYKRCADSIVRLVVRKDDKLECVPPGKGVFGIYRDDLPAVPPFKRRWKVISQDDRGNPGSPSDCVRVPMLVQRTSRSTIPTATGALMRYWGVRTEDSSQVCNVPPGSNVSIKWDWRPTFAIYS